MLGLLLPVPALADTLFTYSDPSGLSAEAEFTLLDPTHLQVRLKNTSTGVPSGFSNSDQILSGVSFDLGSPGSGDINITGGTVLTGPDSASLDFDIMVGPNADVSGEWTYGNVASTGLLSNFISASIAGNGTTPFGGTNLVGPVSTEGPRGGLVADPLLVPLGGLGAVQDEVVATLTLDTPIDDLSFLGNGVRVEFGSDAFFITLVPEPASAALLALGLLGLGAVGRRR